jgi:hypothetical protein
MRLPLSPHRRDRVSHSEIRATPVAPSRNRIARLERGLSLRIGVEKAPALECRTRLAARLPAPHQLLSEQLIPVYEIPRILPPSASGRRLHRAAVWRWVSKGLPDRHGVRIHLEAVRIGRHYVTSRQALARFIARTNGDGCVDRSRDVAARCDGRVSSHEGDLGAYRLLGALEKNNASRWR